MDELVVDPRLSPEFRRRLAGFMGPPDPTSTYRRLYESWYRDHSGGRSEWFRDRLRWRLERSRALAGLQVLDFGCGTGSSAVVIAERGAQVVGVDTERVSLAVAQQRAVDLGLEERCSFVRIPYLQTRGPSLPFPNESFDLCTLIGVLEHMFPEERPACIAEIARVLRPGGEVFIFDTPNRTHPFDHHTTQLWFLGWMPETLARRYAIARQRFDRTKNFRRYGGQGVSRRRIDRLFPPRRWKLSYEKSPQEIATEFGWLGQRATVLPQPWRGGAGRLFAAVARRLLGWLAPLGIHPGSWTASHTLAFTKLPEATSGPHQG